MKNYIKISLLSLFALSAIIFGMNFYAYDEPREEIGGDTIVTRDREGNFSAGTITADLIGNVTGNAEHVRIATDFTGFLAGDVEGTQNETEVKLIGGQRAEDVAEAMQYFLAEMNREQRV